MQRSSPEASAGLSRFDASSVPPLVAPAPTMVWISSMKRIAPGFFLSAVMHGLQALLEVAAEARAGEQRAHVERVDAGVLERRRAPCPRGSCSARPSTMAVLPTPASPTKSGLFLRRRQSTWIVRSSSVVAADQRIDLARGGALDEVDREGLRADLAAAGGVGPRRPRPRRPRLGVALARRRSAAAIFETPCEM